MLIAEHQDAGRGRLARSWVSPPGSGLTVSVLLRPDSVPASRLGWLTLLLALVGLVLAAESAHTLLDTNVAAARARGGALGQPRGDPMVRHPARPTSSSAEIPGRERSGTQAVDCPSSIR